MPLTSSPMELSTAVTLRVATLAAIKAATLGHLTWRKIATEHRAQDVPDKPGVYVWVNDQGAVLYTGKGTGKTGLRGRLTTELGTRWKHLDAPDGRPADADTEIGRFPSGMRYLYRNELTVWYAIVEPDPARSASGPDAWATGFERDWNDLFNRTVEDRPVWYWEVTPVEPPITGADWEAAIQALCGRFGDLRSVIGGGSWEAKEGTRGMAALAWSHHEHARLTGADPNDEHTV